jgi:AsmA protein
MTKRRRPNREPPSLDSIRPKPDPSLGDHFVAPLEPLEFNDGHRDRRDDDSSNGTRDDASLPRIARPRAKRPAFANSDAPASTGDKPKRRKKRPDVSASAPAAHDANNFGDLDDSGSGGKALKYTLIGLASVVGLVVVAATALFLFLPTDLIRDRLVQEVKTRSGRDLTIAGSTSVSLWPRLALSLGNVSLSNASSTNADTIPGNLITADSIEAAVPIWPLLSRDIVIERLVLQKPIIDLIVDRTGRRNWDFAAVDTPWPAHRYAQAAPASDQRALPKELEDFVKGATPQEKAPTATIPGRPRSLALQDVRLVNGTIRYRDQRSGIAEEVRAVNLTTTLTELSKPLTTSATFQWRGEPITLDGTLAPFSAVLDKKPLLLNLTITASPLTASADGMLNPSADGDLSKLDFEGRIKANAPSVERIASWSGRPLPVSIPGPFELITRAKIVGPVAAFAETTLTFDRVTTTGAMTIDNRGPRPHLKGALRFAELDLNAFAGIAATAPAVTVPAPTNAPAPAAASSAQPQSIEDLLKNPPLSPGKNPQIRGYTRRAGWSDDVIDLTALGLLDADLKINFARLRFKDMVTGAGQLTTALKNRAARLTLDDLTLYDGTARGVVTLDGTTGNTVIGSNIIAEGVSALPLLKSLNGFDWLQGRARIAVAIAGQGTTERQIVSTLNGKAEITMGDGALVGLNIPQIIRGLMQGKIGNFDRVPTEKTDFSEFAASAQISNGVVRNQDLRMSSQLLRVTGAGTVNLPTETIDYTLKPKITGNISGQTPSAINVTGLEIPLKIKGSLDKPSVQPELAGLLNNPNTAVQAIQDAAKTPAGQEIQNTVKGLLNGDEAAKVKAKSFLDQLIKR